MGPRRQGWAETPGVSQIAASDSRQRQDAPTGAREARMAGLQRPLKIKERLMFEVALTAFVALFVVIDPPGIAPIFLALTSGASAEDRRRFALRGCAVAAVILAIFGFVGQDFLRLLGVGLPAFRISGGVMLFLIATEMLSQKRSERRSKTANESAEAEAAREPDVAVHDPSVFPLATPLLAGPGSMATMMLLVSNQPDIAGRLIVVAVMLALLALCLLACLSASVIERVLGPTLINVIERVLGVMLGALAVQFIIDGLAQSGLFGHG